MSGIIKAVTKEGGSTLSGRVRLLTDGVFPNPDLNYGYNRLSFSIGGPTPYNRLRYFLSTEYFRTDDDRNCLYKVNAPRKEYAVEGKLTLAVPKTFFLTREGLKFTLDGHHSNYQWQAWSNTYKYWQQGMYANRVRSYKANFTVNHMLAPTTVYEAKAGMFMTSLIRTGRNFAAERADTLGFTGFLRRTGIWDQYFFKGEDWVFNNPEGLSKDSAVLQLWRSYWLSPTGETVYAYPAQKKNFMPAYAMTNYRWGVPGLFVDQGNERTWHYRATNDYLFKFDLTKTISKIHEIKTGIDLTQYSLSMYDNSLPWDQNPFWDAYNYKPLVAAAYVQDRADFEDLVVRAGVRLDYLDSKAEVRVFPESLGSSPEIADSFVPVKPKFRVSPRLGISYPITERIKFRFSYGHFFKNPTFSDLYEYGGRSAAELRGRGNIIVGNPDMSAEKTIAYELGFDAQLTDILAFDLTAFYKDVFDLAGVRIVHALPQPYSMYYNVEYARIQGFEATVTKQLANYWSAQAGYTFQIAKGTASTAYEQYQRETPFQVDYYLDQDQRHAFHANLGLSLPSDFAFKLMRDFEVSAVFTYASGMPYTPTDLRGNPLGVENSGRMPSASTIDGRLSKDIKLAGLTLSLSCDVANLLNAKVVNSVYSATGKPDNDGRIITPYEFSPGIAYGDLYYHPARDYNHDGYLTRNELFVSYVRAYEDKTKAPTYYGPSRKIRFGVSLSF